MLQILTKVFRNNTIIPAQASLTLKLCELGWLFIQVDEFSERQGGVKEYGLVGQSFVTALREELAEYYQLLSVLEAEARDGRLTLLQLCVWAAEPMKRLKLLVELVTAAGTCRGGSLASCIYAFINHGDPKLNVCVSTLLTAACRPLYTMLIRWILDGSLEDPHQEFFIASEPGIQGEALWHHKYTVRKSMIPRFISLEWSRKILSTGKSINFLRSVCLDNSPLLGRQKIIARLEETDPASLFSCDVDNPLLEVAGDAFRQTGQHVLDIMFNKFKFMSHLAALRKYLLLGQGDIMRYLLDLLDTELSQPATELYPHNLAGILETAIRSTNTQYEDTDILERLDVRLLEIQPGDSGWDVFSLDYKVSGPIGVVFTPDIMTRYLMLFNTLWRAKRMEWVLSGVWRKLAYIQKISRELTELRPVLHHANLIASEMIHFVHQMAYYITFEVMECGWDTLVKQIDTAETLEDVIQAHEEFLSTIISRALLDHRTIEIRNQLRTIYDRILEFQNIQEKLYQEAVSEIESRHTYEALVAARTGTGEYGTDQEQENKETDRRKEFIKGKLGAAKANLRIVSLSYQDMVRTFLFQLTCSNDDSLQGLSFRLDFNQHYKKKDSRLSRPLTFSHRRMTGLNGSLTGSQMSYIE
ncbi:gamma-tubulin complex component 3 homolog [Eurytemora carolleeae]|uniref:gamma-tubulin complex component 3 homolog n=1 Tax=Eurytemora carolleeae TaxID=1294199 RepID=UPI000C781862|nr:gamma-tubulin complex component 3 homolog [Eurytemora carolleeae]|eukprot:XP_023329141.1 gamma-tubulin complex component 3 homolog [Eurytemora affinis]